MRLLIDTDVLIDVGLGREPFVQAAVELVDALESNPGVGYISWHTASNFYYLVSAVSGRDEPRMFLYELSRFVDVAPTLTKHLRVAGKLSLPDFEDAMQVSAAIACEADYVVTRNTQDFRKSPVPAIGPAQAVELVTSQ